MGFDLVTYILKKKGLYEEGEEPVGDGTPSDEKKGEGEEGIEPAGTGDSASNAVTELMNVFNGKKKNKKKTLKEGKKPCNECDEGMGTGGSGAAKDVVKSKEDEKNTGPEPTDQAVEALKDWFNMTEEDSAISNEEEPKGLTDAEAKSDNAATDIDKAKNGAPNSPPAEIKEAVRTLRKMAKRLREEAEDDEKAAEGMEDEAEKIEDKAETEEKKDDLKEWAIKLRKKSRRLREEAEDAVEKADALADKAEDVAKAEEPEEDDDEVAEEETVTEWTRNIAATGRKMIRENRAKKIASKLVKLMEEEEVGMGTPGGVDLDSDFGDANDDGTAKRAAAAAPTTEEEAGEGELPD